jgi:hypothetical protein
MLARAMAPAWWTRCRATSETLKHEKCLHRALAGPYAAAGGSALLATSMDRAASRPAEAST